MKTLCLLLFFLPALFRLDAQISFPTDGAVWVNGFYQQMPTWPPSYQLMNVTNYCVNAQDTLINSLNYTKVNECGGAYHGALREVNQEVWYIPKDSTVEYLIYDFSVTPGEVLQNVYFEQGGFNPMVQDLTVTDVTTVQINGIDHVAVDLGSGPMFYWIEGIGCTSGFLCEPWQNISQYQVTLECMSLLGITYYPTYSLEPCPMDLGLEESVQQISISPNPVKDVLQVSFEGNEIELNLYDPSGRKLDANFIRTSEGVLLDMSRFTPGVYFIGISAENGQKVIKL